MISFNCSQTVYLYFFQLKNEQRKAIVLLVSDKESNSTANEGKRKFNRSIIYYLNIVPIVKMTVFGNF